jgi:hypothetical protein
MFLVFNKNDGLVVQTSETEPVLAPGPGLCLCP